ncbi:molybdopterin-dependent oxidoreductase, partial [Streptomyces sp. SID4985]|uniref:molybdopterin-dependent oxidoreductase n=1 Tax=Streptomyces sp. SID4985 TaxID=2690292 RepID=UPI00136E8B66
GGRPATDPRAREEVAAVWGLAELPGRHGRDTQQIVEGAATGELSALLVAGVEVDDLPDPARAREALDAVGFLVSLELRPSEVTERADVVLPVAAVAEKGGTFLNWEGRVRFFEAALKPDQMTRRLSPTDGRVLQMLADAMDVHLGLPDLATTRAEIDRLGAWNGAPAADPLATGGVLPRPAAGEAVLAGHRLLLDLGVLQQGDDALAGTRHAACARVSAATAAEAGVEDGAPLAVTGPAGTTELPLLVTEMPDRVVWLPLDSTGAGVASDTGARPGSLVRIGPAVSDGQDLKEDRG